jgi:pimeloyl-ACP methyl ester carboxylesterase
VSQWVTVNGLRMHARASRGAPPADAPTIELVHGLGMSSRYMEPLLDELAANARVFAPDLPGYGRSASPRKRLTLAGMADALDAWMGAVGIDSAVVAGNSLGAQVIAQLGVRHPDRLTRAVLVGPTRDPSIGGPLRHTLRLALDAPLERPALIGVAVRDYLRAGPKLMYRLFGEALRHREEDQLRHLGVPTLIVRGQRDPICTQGWVEQINRLVPTSRLVVIDGAAHAVNFSAAPQLARAIRTFLADHR